MNMDFLKRVLDALPTVAKSPWAFLAYSAVLVAWVVVVLHVRRAQDVLRRIKDLRPEDQAKLLLAIYGTAELKEGLSPKDWLKSRMHRYVFTGFVILTLAVVFLGALSMVLGPQKPSAKEVARTELLARQIPITRDALLSCADKDEWDTVRLLIEAGVSPDCTTSHGFALLVLAVWSKQPEAVAMLLQLGANPNASSGKGEYVGNGCTALTASIEAIPSSVPGKVLELSESAMLRVLLKEGADPNLPNPDGETPLGVAVSELSDHTRREVVSALIAAGATPKSMGTPDDQPLLKAIEDVALLAILLDAGADPNAAEADGRSALMLATAELREKAVDLLLVRGADAKAITKEGDGVIAHMVGSWGSYAEPDNGMVEGESISTAFDRVVRRCLRGGSHIGIKNKEGDTPLLLAAQSYPEQGPDFQNFDVPEPSRTGSRIRCFLDNGASIADVGKYGDNVVLRLARYHGPDLIDELKSRGAEVGRFDDKGRSAIHLLVLTSPPNEDAPLRITPPDDLLFRARAPARPNFLESLLRNGVDVNAKDAAGQTALMYAVAHGVEWALPVLVAHGADASLKDNEGRDIEAFMQSLTSKTLGRKYGLLKTAG
jgi:ankyrin repeat protein